MPLPLPLPSPLLLELLLLPFPELDPEPVTAAIVVVTAAVVPVLAALFAAELAVAVLTFWLVLAATTLVPEPDELQIVSLFALRVPPWAGDLSRARPWVTR